MQREWSESVARYRINQALETVDAKHSAKGFDKKRWAEFEAETKKAFATQDMNRLADACEKFVEDTNGIDIGRAETRNASSDCGQRAHHQDSARAGMAENKAQKPPTTGIAALFPQVQS